MEWVTTNQSKNKNENKKGKCSGTCGPQNKLFRKKIGLSAKSIHQKTIKIFQIAKCSESCRVGGALVFFIHFAGI